MFCRQTICFHISLLLLLWLGQVNLFAKSKCKQFFKGFFFFHSQCTASAVHILKLERYREDQHGPCARMTRKIVKRSTFFTSAKLKSNELYFFKLKTGFVLRNIHKKQQNRKNVKLGDAGDRTRGLIHAKHALYH